MKIKDVTIEILGGKEHIGGNIILMTFNDKSICLDIGLPLVGSNCLSNDPIGLQERLQKTQYCLISHAHQDHYGQLDLLPNSCVIYSGHDTQTLIRITRFITRQPFVRQTWRNFQSGQSLYLGEFTITPYLIDHSAFDAHSFLIQVGSVNVFYTGDIRFHGRKGQLSKSISSRLRRDLSGRTIDLLITEGTNVSTSTSSEYTGKSEDELQHDFEKVMSSNSLPVVVQVSGQNIDRIVTIYKACLKTHRRLILDPYTAFVISRLNNRRIPQLIKDQWGISVLMPGSVDMKKCLGTLVKKVDWMSPFAVEIEDLQTCPNYVLLFRYWIGQSLLSRDILPSGSNFIYSMSSYYLNKMRYQWGDLATRMDAGDLNFYKLHISGHAYPVDLLSFIEQISYRYLVPIHSDNPAWFNRFGDKLLSWESVIE